MAIRMSRCFVACVCAITLLGVVSESWADTVFWDVDADGDWGVGTNWSGGSVPGPTDDVIIDRAAGEFTITVSSGAQFAQGVSSEEKLRLTGGSLTVSGTAQVNNDFTLMGGTLIDATVLQGVGGAEFLLGSSGGTLDGVTFDTDVGTSGGGAVNLTVVNGLELNGTMTLDVWRMLQFNGGTQTLSGTGEVVVSNGSAGVRPSSGGTLTIAPSMTIRGGPGLVGSSSGGLTINQGTIRSETASQTMSVSTVDNSATVEAVSGGRMTLQGTWSNSSTLDVDGGGPLTLNGTWSNTGTINETNSTLNLGGSFTTADLSGLTRSGGSVNITGTLDNAATTLALNATTGTMILLGGTVEGGTVTTAGGAEFLLGSSGGTLDGVTFDTDVGTSGGGAVNLTVVNGLELNGTMTLDVWRMLQFNGGTQTLSGTGEVVVSNGSAGVRPSSGGTLTIAPSMTIRGGPGLVGSSSGGLTINQGTIRSETASQTMTVSTVDNSATVEAVSGGRMTLQGTWSNSSTLDVDGGGPLTLNGTWSNTGTINETNSTLNLGGSFTTADLSGLTRSGGSVNITGTLDNAATTLALNATTGTMILLGGTVEGGTVTTAGGAEFLLGSSGGTLDGVTFDTDVGTSGGGAVNLTVVNGLELNGTMTLDVWRMLQFNGGTQTLSGTGEVVVSNGSAGVRPSSGGTLTIAPSMTIRGGPGLVGSSSGGLTINQGTIRSETASQTMSVSTVDNSATVEAVSGGRMTLQGTWSNSSTLDVDGGGPLTLNGTWSNTGTINETNSTLNLGGSFTTADLSGLTRSGGSVNITGTLDNAATTLALNATTGTMILLGGTVEGGTVTTAGGAEFLLGSSGGTLDGVTFDTDVGTSGGGAVNLTVVNGLELNGTMTLDVWRMLQFNGGTQTLSGTGEVVVSNGSAGVRPSSGGTLTIAPSMTIRGGPGLVGSSSGGLTINQGTIRSETASQTMTVSTVDNSATVEAVSGGRMTLQGTWSNSSTLDVDGGGPLTLNGTWSNTGTINETNSTLNLGGSFTTADLSGLTRSGGSVNITGTLDNAATTLALNATTGTMILLGGTVEGGTVTTAGGAEFLLGSSGGTLDGVTFDTDVGTSGGGAVNLTVVNGLELNGTMTLDAWRMLQFSGGTQTLSGTGEVVVSNGSAGVRPSSGGTLTIAPSMTIRGGPGLVGSSSGGLTINQGTIRSETASQTMTVSTVDNSATVEAVSGGRMTLQGTWSNSSTLDVDGGGPLTLNGTWSNTGTINETNSTLNLGGSFTTADLSGLTRSGGSVNITGTLDNAATTLALNATTGTMILLGGTVEGGTVTTAGGAEFLLGSSGGTLDGVTFDTDVGTSGGGAVNLTVVNGLELNGTMTLDAWRMLQFSGGTQTLSGTGEVVVSNGSAGVRPSSGGTLTIAPSMTIRGGPGLVGSSSGGLTINQGTIRSETASQTMTVSTVDNSGTLEAIGGGNLTSQTLLVSTGIVAIGAGSQLTANQGLSLQGGVLSGSGTIQGDIDNAASVIPGASPGTLTNDGNYTQQNSGSLEVEIGGTNPGEFDQLVVTDTSTLDGTLAVTLLNPFVPVEGNSFEILQYDSRNGAFSIESLPPVPGLEWSVEYGPSSMSLISTCMVCDTGGPYVADINTPIFFYGTGSSALCGQTIVSYVWDFGDGNVGSGAATTHSYTAVGDYTVTLCLTDSEQNERCCETIAMVREPQGACCLDNGMACAETDAGSCAQAGGVYLGDGTTCPEVNTSVVNEPGGQVFVHVIGPPVACTLPFSPLGSPRTCAGPPFFDPWISNENAQMCNNFGVPGSPAIPADFFEMGSEPFVGTVCLRGVPLGHPLFGDADTIIERMEDPFDRCELPSPSPVMVDIRIVELSLESVQPITVMVNGQPTQWDVDVDLSEVEPPVGTLSATKSHCNGGTYESTLNVQARFTFTKVGEPTQVRVLDTGLEGIPPVMLEPNESFEWASDVGELYAALVDTCSDFHAGFVTPEPSAACDCNANSRRDLCDIEDGFADDCNENAVPDSCDIASGFSPDTNMNGIPDECEVVAGLGDTPAGAPIPTRPRLYQSQPNPFNPSTTIGYEMPSPSVVSLKIYDVAGRLVRVLADEVAVEPGFHTIRWDGRSEAGNRVGSGVYYYTLEAGKWSDTKAMVVVK